MSLDTNKVDADLGWEVQNHLIRLGIQTPTTELLGVYSDIKIEKIRGHYRGIMETLGMDLTDDSLVDTPNRCAKMLVNELNWGLLPDSFPKCTTVQNKMHYDEMVMEKGISVMSTCEHHLVTIDGKCTIAYIPKSKVLGLSKLNRIVEYFSRRPQIQERLTQQIAETLKFILGTDDVGVVIDAVHYCVKSRGVGDQTSSTMTSYMGGEFRDNSDCRKEFFMLSNRV